MSLNVIPESTNKLSVGSFLIISGALLLAFLLIIQYKYIDSFTNSTSIVVSEIQIEFMNSIAVPFFGLFIFSSSLVSIGMILILKRGIRIRNEHDFGRQEQIWKILYVEISSVLNNKQTKKIVIISFVLYLALSLFLNNTILFRPTMGMAQNSFVPSIYIIGCCGSPGTFPVINIHITEYLGLKFVPVNLILPLFYSFLVSISIALTVSALSLKKDRCRGSKAEKAYGMNSVGIVSGFLISCPSCVTNIIISSIFGSGLAASVYNLIFPYQIAISALSFVFMSVVLYFAAKFLFNSKKT